MSQAATVGSEIYPLPARIELVSLEESISGRSGGPQNNEVERIQGSYRSDIEGDGEYGRVREIIKPAYHPIAPQS
jgi:hypothetical protein